MSKPGLPGCLVAVGAGMLEFSLGVPGAGLRPGAGVLCRRDLGSGRAGGLAWSRAASSRTWACRPGLGGPSPVPRGRIRPPSAPGPSPAPHSGRGTRRRMITRRGQGQPRDLAGALCRHGYPHVHSPARPHMHRGLTSVFTQIIHRPIHRALPLAGQRAAGEHESREKAVIPRYTFPPGGREMTFTRIAC